MGNVSFGANIEFVRHADKSFEWGMAKAAELGFEYAEPMVHWGRELLSEAGYFHSGRFHPVIATRWCFRVERSEVGWGSAGRIGG